MSTPSDLVIRPMTEDDVPGADAAAWAALEVHIPSELRPADDAEQRIRGARRIQAILATDPAGCWVAEAGGEVVGCAVALIRDGLWGLSLFGVRPGLQGQGVGFRLLEPAVRYADGAHAGIIASSVDPRAMRLYHRAGFAALPCLWASGPLNASRIPEGLRSRPGDLDADLALLEQVSRAVRGAAHGREDLAVALSNGFELLVHDDRGWALVREGSLGLVAALDEDAATDLLWSCFATAAPGTSVHLSYVCAGNDWALRTALDAGLSLSPDGPLFVRGEIGPLRPYLPSGAYL